MGYDRHDHTIFVNGTQYAAFGLRGAEVVWAHPRVMFLIGMRWPDVQREIDRRGWVIAPAKRGKT